MRNLHEDSINNLLDRISDLYKRLDKVPIKNYKRMRQILSTIGKFEKMINKRMKHFYKETK